MFGIDFNELLLIAVIALVVLGPDRLPGVARTAGAIVRRARSAWASVQAEVARELDTEGLAQQWREGAAAVRDSAVRLRAQLDEAHDAVQHGMGTAAAGGAGDPAPGSDSGAVHEAAAAPAAPSVVTLARTAGELRTLAARLDEAAGAGHDALRAVAADLRGAAQRLDGMQTSAVAASTPAPAAQAVAQQLDALAARLRTLEQAPAAAAGADGAARETADG